MAGGGAGKKMLPCIVGSMILGPIGILGCVGVIVFIGAMMALGLMGGSPAADNGGALNATCNTKVKPATKKDWEEIFKCTEKNWDIPWEFVASITYQETGAGANLGGCSYFPPPPGGGHVLVYPSSAVDTPSLFQEIIDNINAETENENIPKNKPVSCNPAGSRGGAMGYTQIIPSTFKGASIHIERANDRYPTPWNGQDASDASSVILKGKIGVGATEPFPENETSIKKAACSYLGYAGSTTCSYGIEVYARFLEFKERGRL